MIFIEVGDGRGNNLEREEIIRIGRIGRRLVTRLLNYCKADSKHGIEDAVFGDPYDVLTGHLETARQEIVERALYHVYVSVTKWLATPVGPDGNADQLQKINASYWELKNEMGYT
jgi:hypothetical protein